MKRQLNENNSYIEELVYDIDAASAALEEEARLDREEKEYYQKYYAQCETQSYMLPDNFDND